jgi:hypothetical protein
VTAPDGHLSPLDPRFPISLTHGIPLFGGLLEEWVNRETVIDQAKRAAEQAARREERFVTPAPEPRYVPALAHEDTVIDMRITDGDWFPGEGEPRPEDTDTFLVVSAQAEAYEARAAQRRTWRRAWRWLRAT